MKKQLLLALISFSTALNAIAQTTLYISPQGSDKAAGTKAQPFRSLDRAVAQLKQLAGKDVRIYLRKGTYYLSSTLLLNNDAIKTKSLLISAYPDEPVAISAGQKLSLKWQPYRDGIYKAGVPKGISFEQLYINGKLQHLARYPDYDSSARIFNGTAADAIAPERIKKWKHPEGGYLHSIHAYDWGSQDYRINGIDKTGNAILEGGWQNNRPTGLHKKLLFVENIFEELDAPGEWWFDKQQSVLYYKPFPNINLSTAITEISCLKNSIELKGSPTAPLSHISIVGITFLHNERSFMETREPLLRSDWTIYRGGTLLFENTENCSVSNCNFDQVGGNAVMLSGYNKYDTISGNHIHHTGASAICFIGSSDAVRSPSFRYQDFTLFDKMDKTPGPKSNAYPQYCIASDNLIHDIGRIEKQATGVEIEIASHITARHNSIYNTPRAGINIGDGCFGGHLLEYNDVFNTVLETGDHGAFNSWGRDRFWTANRKYMDSMALAHPEIILLDAQETNTIRNNRFRCDHGWDIDLDDGSSNYHIYNNVCLNGGLKLREGFYRTVENNIMVNNSFHPHVWFKNSGDVFRHNIVMKAYAPIAVNYWGKEIDSNLFYTAADLDKAHADNTDAHSVSGDPLFINAAAGNYSVAPQSPAFKIGFQNFSMDSFGVQLPALKKLAATPVIPVLLKKNDASAQTSAVVELLGGRLKSVEGLGERSTYGLPDETGVIIMAVGDTKSAWSVSGFKDKDVIRTAAGKKISTVQDLVLICKNLTQPVAVEVIREQQVKRLTLKIN